MIIIGKNILYHISYFYHFQGGGGQTPKGKKFFEAFPYARNEDVMIWIWIGTKNNKCDVNFFNFDFDLKNQ